MLAKVLGYQEGVIPKLKSLCLNGNAIHDEGLISLAWVNRYILIFILYLFYKNIIVNSIYLFKAKIYSFNPYF